MNSLTSINNNLVKCFFSATILVIGQGSVLAQDSGDLNPEPGKPDILKHSEIDPDASPKNQESSDKNLESLKPLKELLPAAVEVTVEQQDTQIRGMHGLTILVKNNSDRALIFNGDLAVASLRGKEYKCAELEEFEELSGSQPSFISSLDDVGETVAAAVTVGSWQAIHDLLKTKNSGFSKFGKDEERRRASESRFAQRVLWPGDSSAGLILFNSREVLKGAQVKIPVRCLFNAKDQALVSNLPLN